VNLLKGKDVYRPVNTSTSIERVPLPPMILKTHPSEDLDIDFFYVQGAPYFSSSQPRSNFKQHKLLIVSASATRKQHVSRTKEAHQTS